MANQQWDLTTSGELKLRAHKKKCIDVAGGDFTNGNKIQIW
jgi:hypothetical protein